MEGTHSYELSWVIRPAFDWCRSTLSARVQRLRRTLIRIRMPRRTSCQVSGHTLCFVEKSLQCLSVAKFGRPSGWPPLAASCHSVAQVASALIKTIRKLPRAMRKSVTWDRGLELAEHKKLSIATDIKVHFCDPRSPWQRSSNESTNRLLRRYFPQANGSSSRHSGSIRQGSSTAQ